MKVSELAEKAGLTVFNQYEDKEIEGVYISDMVSDIIGTKAGNLLVTLQTHKNLIAAANLVDVAGIVFSRDKKPAEDVRFALIENEMRTNQAIRGIRKIL